MDISTALATKDTAAIRDAINSQLSAKEGDSMGQEDFFSLLLTQLTNQNPLDPMDNTEFIAQMAQFSSLEQMGDMNSQMSSLSQSQSSLIAQSYIGKDVTVQVDSSTTLQGKIDSVSLNKGEVKVQIEGKSYTLDQIVQIHNPATSTEA
ncbi:MAG: flagellar hook capping FlgD N-terminal domain-containing protein [Verrucomicrobiota bacterium JB022]|nr:flagellar hook capping FlgD N-terminal domain-containing protein [Verrucomicrobiota bacterium JB022]